MSTLMVVDKSDIQASFDPASGLLTVTAKIPNDVATAKLTKVDTLSGRKLRFEGRVGDASRMTNIASYTETIAGGSLKFSTVSVVHQDKTTKKEVEDAINVVTAAAAPVPTLVNVAKEDIRADFDPLSGLLTVSAIVPRAYSKSTSFRKIDAPSGRKLRLEAITSGEPQLGGLPGSVQYNETVTGGPLKFSSVSVAHADKDTKKEVEDTINITTGSAAVPALQARPLLGSGALPPSAKSAPPIAVVLPVSNVLAFVRVVAPLPDAKQGTYTLEGRSSGSALNIARAGVVDGQAYWDLTWDTDAGALKGDTFNVILSQRGAPAQISVQPYAISGGQTNQPAKDGGKKPNNSPVDLFDPDA